MCCAEQDCQRQASVQSPDELLLHASLLLLTQLYAAASPLTAVVQGGIVKAGIRAKHRQAVAACRAAAAVGTAVLLHGEHSSAACDGDHCCHLPRCRRGLRGGPAPRLCCGRSCQVQPTSTHSPCPANILAWAGCAGPAHARMLVGQPLQVLPGCSNLCTLANGK